MHKTAESKTRNRFPFRQIEGHTKRRRGDGSTGQTTGK